MSSFSALKTAIQSAIKQNGNNEITGDILQDILLSIVSTLGDSAINNLETGLSSEASTRGNADTTLQTNINNEATARQNADSQLQTNINNEATARQNADTQLNNLITGIKNNIDNGYVYAGIATPSTIPVSGKVFYIATQAGTYTNLGNTAVKPGMSILKYNGSAWSNEQVIYTDGGVFDVSAYNGGATYASLEALLSDANLLTIIPPAVRKGGMSIKFVQTDDNKYVQYRYMSSSTAAADFTNVANWQGVDINPVINSKNLVESGGAERLKDRVIKCLATSDSAAKSSGKIEGVGDLYFNTNAKKVYRCSSYTDTTTMSFTVLEDASKEKVYFMDGLVYIYNGSTIVLANNGKFSTGEYVNNIALMDYAYKNSGSLVKGGAIAKNITRYIKVFATSDSTAKASGKITAVNDLYYHTPSKTLYRCTSYTDSSTMSFSPFEPASYEKVYLMDGVIYLYDGTTLVIYNKETFDEIRTHLTLDVKCLANGNSAAIELGKITKVGDLYINMSDKNIYKCTSYTDSSTMTFSIAENPSVDKIYMIDGVPYYYTGTTYKVFRSVVKIEGIAASNEDAFTQGIITSVGQRFYNSTNKTIRTCTHVYTSSIDSSSAYSPNEGNLFSIDGSIYIFNGDDLIPIQTDVTSLENAISTLQDDVRNINGDIENIEGSIEEIEASLESNPPAVVALRNELTEAEERIDALEQAAGITPPTVTGYKKIASETIVTQAELNSWDGLVVEVIGDLVLSGSTDYQLNDNCIIFMNGGRFINDSYTGTLNLNDAYVKAEPYPFIDIDISFSGSLLADVSYAEWFGAKGDGITPDSKTINKLTSLVKCNEIHLLSKTYILNAPIYAENTVIKGCENTLIERSSNWADIPITSSMTSTITAVDGKIAVTLDTTSATFQNLKVGDAVNIVPRLEENGGGTEPNRNQNHYEWKNRLVQSINTTNGEVVLSGGDWSRIGASNNQYNLITEFPLLVLYKGSKLYNLKINGRSDVIGSDGNNFSRAYWRCGASVCVGVQDQEPSNAKQCYGAVVANCTIDNSVADGVVVLGSHNHIKDNIVRHSGANAIHLSFCTDVEISNNFLLDSNKNMATDHNDGAITYSNYCKNICIKGNYFDTCRNAVAGINSPTNCQSIITDNIFTNFRGNAISIYLQYETHGNLTREFIISSNRFVGSNFHEGTWEFPYEEGTVTNAAGRAISCSAAGSTTLVEGDLFVVSGNVLKDCGMSFVRCVNLTITGNNISYRDTFSAGDTRPTDIIKLQSCITNLNGNTIRNFSDSLLSAIINVSKRDNDSYVSKLLVCGNVLSTVAGQTVNADADTTLEQYGNMTV